MRESIEQLLYAYNENERLFLQGCKERVAGMSDPHANYVFGREVVSVSGRLIDVRRHTRFLPVPAHRHDYLEAVYLYNGTLTQVIDGERITMHRGDFMLLNQGITHAIETTGQSDIALNLVILPEFFDYLLSLVDGDNLIMNFILDSMYRPHDEGGYLWYRAHGESVIAPLMDEIIENLYEPSTTSGVTIKLLAGLVLVRLAEHIGDVSLYEADGYEKHLGLKILRYVDENYREGSLRAVSDQLAQPEWRVCRIVKRYTGQTFKQLVQDTRLTKAAAALTHTARPVAEIADRVGYRNMTYFYRLFKERFGMTPAAYRAAMGEEVTDNQA